MSLSIDLVWTFLFPERKKGGGGGGEGEAGEGEGAALERNYLFELDIMVV